MEHRRHALGLGWSARCAAALLVFLILPGTRAEVTQPSTATSTTQTTTEAGAESLPPGSAAAGRELFFGTRRFAKGGPSCASCHQSAGTPFPNGGTLGPDLTGIYNQFGPEALQSFLQTLFFPTMAPIFDKRPLTPQEQSDLAAFFQQTSNQPPSTWLVAKIVVPAFGGFFILLVLTGGLWRRRLRQVRKSLVAQATGEGRP
jgi:mono/diheme cytochrome c family protein